MRKQWVRKRWAGAAIGLVIMLLLAGCMGAGGTSSPKLAVDHTLLDFGTDKDELSFRISNAGNGRLSWNVEGGKDWLAVDPVSGENSGTVTVTVDRTQLADDEVATLTIRSNGGTVDVVVSVSVGDTAPPPPGKTPDQVRGLDARGFTLPAGVAPLSASAYSASSEARALLDLVKELEAVPRSLNSFGAGGGTFGPVAHAAMPAGYTGAFVLSWDAVEDATAYRIFTDVGSGWITQDVSVYDLEDPAAPTFMLSGNYDVGTTASFVVQAVNGTKIGSASDPDGAVIIAPQTLSTPASGSSTSPNPQFVWNAHDDATGYMLYLATGNRFNHFWTQVVDQETTTGRYPGDDHSVKEQLDPGAYLWFVVAQGPTNGDRADAYAVSNAWTFTVRP